MDKLRNPHIDPTRFEHAGLRGGDRRSSQRHPSSEVEAVLGWWSGDDFRTTGARLLDVSLEGAAIEAKDRPVAGDPVYLALSGSKAPAWIAATIVGVRPVWLRAHALRLHFDEPCPYDFFRAAVQGIQINGR